MKSILILLLAMASIQFGASQAKQLFTILGVAGTSTARLCFASLIMVLLARPWRHKFSRENIKGLILYGASLGLMNFSFYFALKRIPLGIAVALEFIGPLSVAVFSSKKRVDFLWIILAASGIFLLLPKTSLTEAPLDPLGIGLALLAGAFWALYIIFGKRAGSDLQGNIASSMGMLVAALIVLPAGLIIDGPKLLNLSALPAILIVAVFGSALPYSLEMVALKRMPARTFGVLMSLEPALAALMGFLFLSETLTLTQWFAIGCVIVSSFGSTMTQK